MSRTITSGFGTHRKLTICYNNRDGIISISQSHPSDPNINIKLMKDCLERFIETLHVVIKEGRGFKK